MTTIPIAAPAVVQTEPQTPADRKTPKHEAESNWFTPDELMSGAQSKTLWIRTGLYVCFIVDYSQKLLIFVSLPLRSSVLLLRTR